MPEAWKSYIGGLHKSFVNQKSLSATIWNWKSGEKSTMKKAKAHARIWKKRNIEGYTAKKLRRRNLRKSMTATAHQLAYEAWKSATAYVIDIEALLQSLQSEWLR